MKRKFPRVALLIVSLTFLQILALASDSHIHQRKSASDAPTLDDYIEEVSELSSRARANVYFQNPQSIFNGVQVSFVNVGTGNLTFLRRDLVASGRIPLVFARVYDSSGSGSIDFGPGWTISAAERIDLASGKARLFSENGTSVEFITSGDGGFQLAKDYLSDYLKLVEVTPETIRATLRTGFSKEFKLIGGSFRLVRVTDRNGNEIRLVYDGELLSKIENTNHFVQFTRDDKGRITIAQDDANRTVRYSYDGSGRLSKVEDLGGQFWTYSYNDRNQLNKAADPSGRVNFEISYTDSGEIQRLRLPSGVVQYRYDHEAGLTTITDRKQLISRFYQNEEGITTRIVNALGEETAIDLDEARDVRSLSRNGSVVEKMDYDLQHRLVARHSSTTSGIVDHTYSYDSLTGLLTGIHSSSGQDQAFAYDASGNLINATVPDGVHKYGYSPTGDLASLSVGDRSISFTSDADGMISSMAEPKNGILEMKHKAGGELSEVKFSGAQQVHYEYQPSGLRAEAAIRNGGRAEYNYDSAGNLTGSKIFDRKGKQINGQSLEMDDSYELIRWTLFDGTETTFQYDPNGNLTEIKKAKSRTRFEYDSLNRLVAIITPNGQRLVYSYKPGERSLIEQHQHAAILVEDLRDTGLTFAAPLQVMATRPVGSVIGSVRFSEALGTFQLSNGDGSEIARPQENVEAALKKLFLFDRSVPPQALKSGFNIPFNTMFMPAEYVSINCCPECYYDGDGWYCPPCLPALPSPPSLDAPSPSQAAINAGSVQVTFTGAFNDTSESITISGTGVTASPNPAAVDATGTQFTTTLTIANTATVSDYSITVSDSGGTSNAVTFTVIPGMDLSGNNDFIFVGTDPGLASANTLFASVTPTGGTLTVTSSDPSDAVTIGSLSGIPKATITTPDQSTTNLDRTLTFTYTVNSKSNVQKFNVTARKFAFASNGPLSNTCSLGNGYDYTIVYNPFTHPDGTVVPPSIGLDGTIVTESFSASTDPTPCQFQPGNGNLDANSEFSDRIAQCSTSPIPQCSTTTTQSISVAGFFVRSNSLVITNTNLTYTSQGPTQ